MNDVQSSEEWVPITLRLPADGEVVFVKMHRSSDVRRVKYLAEPFQRWEEPAGLYQLNFFACWRPT
jgi:hypothetical protein